MRTSIRLANPPTQLPLGIPGGKTDLTKIWVGFLLLFTASAAKAEIAVTWNEVGAPPIVNGVVDTSEPIEFTIQFTNQTGATASQIRFESPTFPPWIFEATTCGNVAQVTSTSPLTVDLQGTVLPGQTVDILCVRARAPSCWPPLASQIGFRSVLTYTAGGVGSLEKNLTTLDLFIDGGVGFQIDKAVVPPTNTTATPGEVVDFRLTLSNPVDFQANVFLSDVLPAGTELVSAPDFSCDGTDAGSTCQLNQFVDCGDTFTYDLSVRVLDPLPAGITQIENTGVAVQGQRTVMDSATLAIDSSARPDLTISKTGPASAVPGERITYQVTATNMGSVAASSVTVTDVLPPFVSVNGAGSDSRWNCNAGTCTASLGTLPGGGGSTTLPLVVTVDNPVPAGTDSLLNLASVATPDAETDSGNNSAQFTAILRGPGVGPDLTVSKSGPATAAPGDQITYQIIATNQGNVGASAPVVNDALPPFVTVDVVASDPRWNCGGSSCTATLNTMDGGGTSETLLLVVTVDDPLPPGTNVLVNQVAVSTPDTETDISNNLAQANTTISGPGVGPDLTVSKAGPVTAGPDDLITYQVTVENVGNVGATTPVVVDTLPNHVSYLAGPSDPRWSCSAGVCSATLGSLAGGGASDTLDLAVVVDDPLPAGIDTLLNSVNVSTPDAETNTGNNSAEHQTTIGGGGVGPDLIISKSGPAMVIPGETIIYEITVMNDGNIGASAPLVVDSLPATVSVDAAASDPRWNCAGSSCTVLLSDLAGGGGSETLDLVVTVANPLPAGTTSMLNTVNVSTADVETDDSNNSAEHVATVGDDDGGVGPDLTVSKSGPETVVPGETILYEVAVTNLGNVGATTPSLTDTLPTTVSVDLAASDPRWDCGGGVCTAELDDLAGGGDTETLELAVTVADPLPAGTSSVLNTIFVSTVDTETDDSNNSAEHIATVGDGDGGVGPDLTVSKSGPETVVPGETILYEITVTNFGNVGATAPSLTDTLPTTVSVDLAASDPRWDCGGGICTAELDDLAGGGGTETLELAVTVADPLPAGTTSVLNMVVAATDDTETDDGNNSAEHVATVGDGDSGVGPDLTVSKSGPETVVPGETILYEITVTNLGNVGATSPSITDTLPATVSVDLAASDPRWNCSGGVCTAELDDLAGGGGTETLELVVAVVDPLPAGTTSVLNSVLVSTSDTETDDSNNSAEHVATVGDGDGGVGPDLTVSKMGPETVVPGETILYEIVVTNLGNVGTTRPVITDTLPVTVTVDLAASDPQWNCDGGICSAELDDLVGGGGTEMLELVVTVADPLPAGTSSLLNAVLVSTSDTETDDSNNSAEHVATVGDGDGGVGPDLALSKSGPESAIPGESILYEIEVTNLGNIGASAPTITDTLPATVTVDLAASDPRWSCDNNLCTATLEDLPGGGAGELLELSVVIVDPLPVGTTSMLNMAHVATTDAETDESNNSAEHTVVLGDGGGGVGPDLTVSKAGPETAVPGETMIYTVEVTNLGNVGASTPMVTDTLPPTVTVDLDDSDPRWTCLEAECTALLNNLAGGGASEVLELAVSIVDLLPAGTTSILNTVEVSTSDAETDESNNSAQHTTVIDDGGGGVGPDLTVVKSGPATALPGDSILYELTVTNLGNVGASTPVLVDFLPPNVTVDLDLSDPRWTCQDNECSATLDSLAGGGESETLELTVILADPLPVGTTALVNTVTVSTPDLETNTENNSAEATTVLDSDEVGPDLTVTKSGPAMATPGGALIYQVTVTNLGNVGAPNPTVTDTLPPGVLPSLPLSDPRWICTDTACIASLADLAGGASEVLELLVVADDPLPPGTSELVNLVSISTSIPETNENNNTAETIATIVESASDVSITIWSSQDVGVPENLVDFNLVLQNHGPDPATDLLLRVSTEGLEPETIDERFYSCEEDLCLDFAEVPAGFVLDDLLIEGFPQGEVVVMAVVTVSSPDPDLANNEDRLVLPLLNVAAVPVLGPFGFLVTFIVLVVVGWRRLQRG